MAKEKKYINENERGYYYWEIPSGAHNHIKTRVWIHRSFVQTNDSWGPFIEIPIKARVYRTEKGSLVLRPAEGWSTYLAEVGSGYRGSASITRIEGSEAEIVASGSTYHSPRGRLGETAWALVCARGPIEVYGQRTGRRISQSEVAIRLTPDGEIEELITDPEVCDLLE